MTPSNLFPDLASSLSAMFMLVQIAEQLCSHEGLTAPMLQTLTE